jgi:polysaccharide export outer membrane protein
MLKLVNVIPAIIFCSVTVFGQDADKAPSPPKELVQYVRDAQKAGLNKSEIEQNAVNAGWPAVMVTDALASMKTGASEKPKVAEAEKPKAAEESKTATPAESGPAARTEDSTANGGGTTPAAANPPAGATAATPAPEAGTPAATDKAGGTPVSPAKETKTAAPAPAEAGNPKEHPAVANIPDEYKIGAGDVLKITVWHEPDASVPTAVVLPTGRISVPLLHEVDVDGLTVPQLEKLLTERFSSLINTPEVSVVVLGMNSKKIYMTGKVKKEGPLPYIYEMTVMQALTEAGGVTDYAKKKNIYVLRTENGKQFKIPFDYAAVLKGEHLETNIQLIPGDMIVVP